VKRVLAGVVVAAIVSGCGAQRVRSPVEMRPTPRWALAACASVAQLRRFCPAEVPATRSREWMMAFTAPRRGFPLAVLELQSGVALGGFWEHDHRPPLLGNTVVLGGDFLRLERDAFPAPGTKPVSLRNGIADGYRHRPLSLGARTWSGIRGQLSLTPSTYAAEGELADLVVFRWRDSGGDHAVGLNVWEPITQAVATLRAMVSTLAPQPPAEEQRTSAVVDGVPLATTPPWLGELCRARPLRVACPRRVPAGGAESALVDVVPTPRSERPRLISLVVGVNWLGTTPKPQLVHLELTAGRVRTSRRYARAIPISRLRVPRGYVTTLPVLLGRRAWTANPGELVFGDCFGNHLCYRWREGGRGYQIDLHAWDPVGETVDVLRAIVLSTPAARRK
jgi:hypothetical protein